MSGKSIKKRSHGVEGGGGREFNMYEKMHDATGERETQGMGLKLPSIFIITFIRERRRGPFLTVPHSRSVLRNSITYLK